MSQRYLIAVTIFAMSLHPTHRAYAAEGADEVCPTMGDLAENIMRARQNKVPLSTAIDQVVGGTDGDAAKAIVREVILQAYEKPAYSTEQAQSNEIADFRNEVEIGCYRQFSN